MRLNIQEELEHLIQDALAHALFPGIEIYYQHDGFKYHESFGTLDGDPTKGLKKHSIFDVASITKPMVTSLVLLKLVHLEKLSLDDKVSKYLPNFTEDGKDEISLLQLVTHQAGLKPEIKLYLQCDSKTEAIHEIIHSELDYKPGTQVQYSCLGYILLGEVFEKVTGRKLPKLFAQYIKNPLKMKKSFILPTELQKSKFTFVPTGFKPHLDRNLVGEVHDGNANFLGGYAGNAGLFASPSDIFKIAKNLMNDDERIIPNALKSMFFENFTGSLNEGRSIGLIAQEADENIFWSGAYGHTGYTGGSVVLDPRQYKCLIALSNRSFYAQADSLSRMKIFREKMHMLFSEAKFIK